MSNNNVGAGILVLGELSHIENNARRATEAANSAATSAMYGEAIAERKTKEITFAAKSQIHAFRAAMDAHEMTEDQLIAALKEENPNHPLADRDAVDVIFEENRISKLHDAKTIKRTYPDGVIPEGSIRQKSNGRDMLCPIGGEPAFPNPVRNYDKILESFKLTKETVNDPEVMRDCVSKQEKYAQGLKDKLAADDKKGFFTSLNKEKRKDLENSSAWADSYLSQLNTLLVNASEYKDKQLEAEQKKEREDAARARLKGLGMLKG